MLYLEKHDFAKILLCLFNFSVAEMNINKDDNILESAGIKR